MKQFGKAYRKADVWHITVKRVIAFSIPSRDVTNQTHPDRGILYVFPGQNIANLFHSVQYVCSVYILLLYA